MDLPMNQDKLKNLIASILEKFLLGGTIFS